ncbi:MAG: pro-sigmaK processing inhibitor BofA family protein [Bacillota bacterium]
MGNGGTMVLILLGILGGLLLLGAYPNFVKNVVVFLTRSVLGGFFLLLCQTFGFGLGLNVATVCTLGLLGVPGFLGLLSLHLFL